MAFISGRGVRSQQGMIAGGVGISAQRLGGRMGIVQGGGKHTTEPDGKNFCGCSLEWNFVYFFFPPPFIRDFSIITTIQKGVALCCCSVQLG